MSETVTQLPPEAAQVDTLEGAVAIAAAAVSMPTPTPAAPAKPTKPTKPTKPPRKKSGRRLKPNLNPEPIVPPRKSSGPLEGTADGPAEDKESRKKGGKKKKDTAKSYPLPFVGCEPPQALWKNRRIGSLTEKLPNGEEVKGVLHLCGWGQVPADIMFISPCVLSEELYVGRYGGLPRMLQGAPANLFLRNLGRSGIGKDWFYTALVKYNVPRLKPTAADIHWGMPALEDEIKFVKPKIIVCLGKVVFDQLYGRKLNMRDIQGGFFYSEKWDCLLYPMDTLISALLKPEAMERALVDLKEIRQTLLEVRGTPRVRIATDYHVLTTGQQLANWVADMRARPLRYLGADCEWRGQTYRSYNALLRSAQFSWKPGSAVYVRFGGETGNYEFDVNYDQAAEILDPLLNDPAVLFVGHNFVADALWLHEFLKVKVFQRCGFDTMFAQQLLNEYADLKLERLAVKYTDLGRYDQALYLWKKDTGFDDDAGEGYGFVPDKLLIQYALKDVDATLRMAPILMQQLLKERLWDYYRNFTLPFTTDGFYELSDTGLPVNEVFLDEMREVFTRNENVLIQMFQHDVHKESQLHLRLCLGRINANGAQELFKELIRLHADFLALRIDLKGGRTAHNRFLEAEKLFKDFVGNPADLPRHLPVFMHWWEAVDFKVKSTDFLKRWFFDVKRLTPLKTTKKDGIQMAWERVAALPPDRRAQYQPAADKQTIKLFADRDPLIRRLEELKAVGNVVKAFLKGPDEEGREQGMHKWIQPDGKIHANFALTETARPRAWQPNILNWPKAISKPIEAAFRRINRRFGLEKYKELRQLGKSPADIKREVMAVIHQPSSLRACIQAPKDWVFIDMDLKTAEIVALANLSGDTNMLQALSDPDTQFAFVKTVKNGKESKKQVRVAFNELTKAPERKLVRVADEATKRLRQVEKYIRDPKLLVPLDHPDLIRDKAGKLIHPLRDLHYEMAERVNEDIRENLDREIDRGAGKIGNFSIPYGASPSLLERQIEVLTGKKTEVGLGQKIIDAYNSIYPVAARFLKSMEQIVEEPGYYRAISGRVRHFFYNEVVNLDGLRDWTRKGILSPLTRQARNFPMQNLVADSTAKSLLQFILERKNRGMQSRVMMLLYDAVTAIAPLEEVKEATALLKHCLTDGVTWTIHGRPFHFDVDIGHSFRWAHKPSESEKELIKKYL